MVVFDTTIALLFLRPGANPPPDPATGTPVQHAEARIALFGRYAGKGTYSYHNADASHERAASPCWAGHCGAHHPID
jgi:hypothetical protein